jgi:hypothetical protein
MRRRHIEVTAHSQATPDAVFALLGDGTTIRWQASFPPKVPGTGWALQRGLRRFLDQCAEGLARHAAQ